MKISFWVTSITSNHNAINLINWILSSATVTKLNSCRLDDPITHLIFIIFHAMPKEIVRTSILNRSLFGIRQPTTTDPTNVHTHFPLFEHNVILCSRSFVLLPPRSSIDFLSKIPQQHSLPVTNDDNSVYHVACRPALEVFGEES